MRDYHDMGACGFGWEKRFTGESGRTTASDFLIRCILTGSSRIKKALDSASILFFSVPARRPGWSPENSKLAVQ
jgi:hypothetical protein